MAVEIPRCMSTAVQFAYEHNKRNMPRNLINYREPCELLLLKTVKSIIKKTEERARTPPWAGPRILHRRKL